MDSCNLKCVFSICHKLSDTLLGDNLRRPIFASHTDLATQGIIFESAFLIVNAVLFRNCRPSLFGSAATISCGASPKNISVMLDMGICNSGIGLLPSYRTNFAPPCRRLPSAALALQLWRSHQLTMSLYQYQY